MAINQKAIPTPPLLGHKFAKYILGFGVSVVVALAPYLGRIGIPGFSALLTLIPDNVQNLAIPISAAVMGVLSVWTQWSSSDKTTINKLKKAFKRTFIAFFIGLLLLIVVHSSVVVTIKSASILVGFTHPNKYPCQYTNEDDFSNEECIAILTLNQERISAHWGSDRIRYAKMALVLTYLIPTGCFGVLIGLLIMRQEFERRQIITRANKKN